MNSENYQISVPVLTAEKYSALVGLPIGVVNAQLDRRIIPCLRFGKRRMVNLEALRLIAVQSHEVHA